MNIVKRSAAMLFAVGLLTGSVGLDPVISAETEWNMHHVWVSSRQEAIIAQQLADRVNERTGNDFKLTVYPGGSLGIKDQDILRILPPGNAVQMNLLSTTYVTRDAPAIAYSMPEGILSTPEDMVKFLPALEEVYNEEFSKWGIKYLGALITPDRSIGIFCKQPVNTLEVLRTKKVRVWSGVLVENFAKIGVTTVVIPQSDLYMALQTGVVDCAVYYTGAANTISLQEVAPYWAEISYYALPSVLIASQAAWEKLPKSVQVIFEEEVAAIKESLLDRYLNSNYERAEADKFIAAGGKELGLFPEEDRRAFHEAAVENWEGTLRGLGDTGSIHYERLRAALGGG